MQDTDEADEILPLNEENGLIGDLPESSERKLNAVVKVCHPQSCRPV